MELILGVILPILYIASTVMMFNDFETMPTMVVGAISVACLAFGIRSLARG